MKASDIISYLKLRLPYETDLFNDVYSISSLTRSGSTVTAITTENHNLSTNDIVHISGSVSPNAITSLRLATDEEKDEILTYLRNNNESYTDIDYIAMAEITNAHDLTENWQSNITITGTTQSEYNGEHQLLRVQNRKNFSYKLDSEPVSPATGSPILLEDLSFGYNGQHLVTVVNDTTFTYEITSTPGSPAQGTIKAKSNPRISGALSIDRAIKSYTKMATNDLWAFVVLGDTVTSKDRNTLSDAIASRIAGNDFRLRSISQFSIYIFSPSSASIAARYERDLMEDIKVYLSKAILRAYFPSGYTDLTQFTIVPSGNGLYSDNNAFIVYKFDFEVQYDITYEDTITCDDNVAFRDINLDFKRYFGNDALTIMSTSIDLDDKPLT